MSMGLIGHSAALVSDREERDQGDSLETMPCWHAPCRVKLRTLAAKDQ